MKITNLIATFGKLHNSTLTLGEGLNIITAPNESGKSTWAAFIQAMLYGIDTKDRDKKGYLADKNRHQPWSGAPMAGELTLRWGNRDITLRRGAKGMTPFGAFSATYAETEEPVPALTAESCGFTLTGVERELFVRSAFLTAGSHAVTATPELERRIAALVTTGEEEQSFSQVEQRLKEWGRLRRVNKSVGLIPKLERELVQLEESLRQMAILNGDIATLSAQKLDLTARIAQLDDDLLQHQLWEQRRKNQKYCQAEDGRNSAQRQLDALLQDASKFENLPTQERLRHWQGELAVLNSMEKELKSADEPISTAEAALLEAQKAGEDNLFGHLTPQDALGLCQRETTSYETLANGLKKLRYRPLIFTLLMLIGTGLLVGATLYFKLLPYVPMVGGGVLGILWIVGLIATHSKKKSIKSQMSTILERYHLENIAELLPLGEDYAGRQKVAEDCDTALRSLLSQKKLRQEQRDSLLTRIMEFVHTFSPQVAGLIGCSAAISRALHLEEELSAARSNLAGAERLFQAVAEEGGSVPPAQNPTHMPPLTPLQLTAQRSAAWDELSRVEGNLAQLLGRQQASGDPAALAAQREQVAEELSRRETELSAIDTALNALRSANAQLQERFSPQLNARAAHYLSLLTGGEYTALSLSRELEANVRHQGETLPHSALFLSRGTADQLYLAVRLAVCDLCLPAEEPIPLVLDDALTAFDQSRMERALDLLCQMGAHRQIILFSCHRREADYLAGRENVTCHTL